MRSGDESLAFRDEDAANQEGLRPASLRWEADKEGQDERMHQCQVVQMIRDSYSSKALKKPSNLIVNFYCRNDAQIPLGSGLAFNREESETEYMSATLE